MRLTSRLSGSARRPSDPWLGPDASRWIYLLPIVRITSGGSINRRIDADQRAAQDPAALAGREPWGQQPVVDLSGHCEAVEHGRGEIQPLVIGEAVGRSINIPDGSRDNTVAIRIDPLNFFLVGFEQSSLQVPLIGHEGS